MKQYGNGLDTKDRILRSCKDLFYQKGYENTTFKDIGNLAEVNQGLIVYHYKNKVSLAQAVFREYIKYSVKAIQNCFRDYDPMTQYFINDFLYFRLLSEDEPFRKFMRICCTAGILNGHATGAADSAYNKYYQDMMDCITQDASPDTGMMEAAVVAFDGIKSSYTVYVCDNYLSMNIREISENYISLYCRMFGIEKSNYGGRMMQAEILSNQVDVSIQSFVFKLSFHTKNVI